MSHIFPNLDLKVVRNSSNPKQNFWSNSIFFFYFDSNLGSTPPSLTGSVTKETVNTVLISSAECYPSETNLKDNSQLIPKKQLSADDALQLQQSIETNLTIQPITIAPIAPTLSLKLPTSETSTKVTKKPPQSPAPLSPRLLARNKIAANLLSGLDGNLDNNNEVPRGRSKTISVVREHYRGSMSPLSFI